VKLIIKISDKDVSEDKLKNLLNQNIGEYQYILVSPKDKAYKIEEIRTFINQLNKKQNDYTNKRFYILSAGDNLSAVCQNALLKTLEESKYSVGILVSNPFSLLPTVTSRCQITFLDFQNSPTDINSEVVFEDISGLAKLERRELVLLVEQKMLSLNNFSHAPYYQEAINRLNANCKAESVLIELFDKIKQNS